MADYDRVASTYDQFYELSLRPAANKMIAAITAEIAVSSRLTTVELAAGTGEVTADLIAIEGSRIGRLTAVDISDSMLQLNQNKHCSSNGATFKRADAVTYLRSLPDQSVDCVVCAWGVCYMDPDALKSQLARVLKTGGYIAIIENRKGSLGEHEQLFARIIEAEPVYLARAPSVKLPQDAKQLRRSYIPKSATALTSIDDEQGHAFSQAEDVFAYLVQSGVAAGYLDAVRPSHREAFLQDLMGLIRDAGDDLLHPIHRYSLVTARV